MTIVDRARSEVDPLRRPRSRTARFGVFELDAASGELRRNGTRVPIQDQPVRLLAFLLEHAGELITREELRQNLWPAEFVDFEHSLNTAVRKLRAALDDSADNPRFIETLARRGYRFIAPVSWSGEEPLPQLGVAARPRAKWIPIAIVAAVAITLFAGAITYFSRRTAPPVRLDSVAVLPFFNADPGTQHVNDGLTEMLIDSISRLPSLRVMAPATVFRYKNADPARAAKELGVAAVVSGSIRRENDQFVVHVEMIDARDGAQLWARRYDATPSQLPATRIQIANDVAAQLGRGLKVRDQYTTTPEAYDLYTKGLYAWNQRGRQDLQHALDYFNAAIAKDPNFAAAYSGIAKTYGVLVGYNAMPVTEGTAKVVANAQKALDLDPNNAEALVSLATTKYHSLWDFAGADADYKRALQLNPNYATGHEWYAEYLVAMGRWGESRREIDTAYRLDPFSMPITTMNCCLYYYERRYHEAIAYSRGAAQLDQRLGSPLCEAHAYIAMGDIAAAAAAMKNPRAAMFEPHSAEVAAAYDRGGEKAFFRKWCEVSEQDPANQQPIRIAIGYAHLGDRDRAFMWLEKAYERRVSMLTDINVEPAFDSLHGDPRWDDLVRRIGLPKVQPPPHTS